jgi:hypothetical protein
LARWRLGKFGHLLGRKLDLGELACLLRVKLVTGFNEIDEALGTEAARCEDQIIAHKNSPMLIDDKKTG